MCISGGNTAKRVFNGFSIRKKTDLAIKVSTTKQPRLARRFPICTNAYRMSPQGNSRLLRCCEEHIQLKELQGVPNTPNPPSWTRKAAFKNHMRPIVSARFWVTMFLVRSQLCLVNTCSNCGTCSHRLSYSKLLWCDSEAVGLGSNVKPKHVMGGLLMITTKTRCGAKFAWRLRLSGWRVYIHQSQADSVCIVCSESLTKPLNNGFTATKEFSAN